MTNIVTTYAELKSVLLALMLADASNVATNMHLEGNFPIKSENVTMASVHSPATIPILGVGGVFDTTNWMFSYPRAGKLAYIVRKQPDWWQRADPQEYRKYAVPQSLLNTNRAYALATNWLSALSVDLKRLSEVCQVSTRWTTILDMTIPDYSVVWSCGTNPIAGVQFLEPGLQLWQVRVEDPSFLMRPSITNGLVIRLTAGAGSGKRR